MWATGTRSARPMLPPSTVVIVSPWTSTSGRPGPSLSVRRSDRRARANERLTRLSQPGMSRVRAQVAPPGAAGEPEIGLAEPELLEEGRDLLHLLTGGRQHVAMAAPVEPEQHRRELDQLPGRSEDDEDHEARAIRSLAASASPRHMPAPWATAYTGARAANEPIS